MRTRDVGAHQDEQLADIVRRIVAAIEPDRIILFGSRVRGEARPDSDYDLLVIKDTAERALPLERRAYRALKGVRVGVDVLVETPERTARLAGQTGNVIGDALHEGIVLFERDE